MANNATPNRAAGSSLQAQNAAKKPAAVKTPGPRSPSFQIFRNAYSAKKAL